MSGEEFEIYAEFMGLYHENYPENILVIVGDRDTQGHLFA